MESPISTPVWQEFYLLAAELLELSPWEWMYDVDLFGVQDPDSGEIGYCGFLGAGNGVRGFTLFRGSTGLFSFERLIEQNPEQIYLLESFQLDGLMLTFREVDGMIGDELDYLRSTGQNPTPGTIVPILKDHVPGKMPWKVSSLHMVIRMTHALQQAILLAKRFRNDPDLLDDNSPLPDRILVRVPKKTGKSVSWTDSWMPEPNLLSEVEKGTANTLLLRSRCSGQKTLQDEWLTDIFYFPKPIQQGDDRPILPQMVLVASSNRHRTLGKSSFLPGELAGKLDEFFVDLVDQEGGVPTALVATRPESYGYWLPIAEALSLEIQLRTSDPVMEDLKAQQFNSLPI